jgi:hypothetical protein
MNVIQLLVIMVFCGIGVWYLIATAILEALA